VAVQFNGIFENPSRLISGGDSGKRATSMGTIVREMFPSNSSSRATVERGFVGAVFFGVV
jgi:hypothetical protein